MDSRETSVFGRDPSATLSWTGDLKIDKINKHQELHMEQEQAQEHDMEQEREHDKLKNREHNYGLVVLGGTGSTTVAVPVVRVVELLLVARVVLAAAVVVVAVARTSTSPHCHIHQNALNTRSTLKHSKH